MGWNISPYALGRSVPNNYSPAALAFYRQIGAGRTPQDRSRQQAHGYSGPPRRTQTEAQQQLALKMIAAKAAQDKKAAFQKKQQAQSGVRPEPNRNRQPTGAAAPGGGGGKSFRQPPPGAPQTAPNQADVQRWTDAAKFNQAAAFNQAAQWDNPAGKGIDQWLESAAQHEGISAADIPQWKQGLSVESGSFDPNAINLTDDNARRGTPSIGPAQVIQPTFNAHADVGWNIRNPIHNIVAGSRYARGRYGANWLRAMIYGSDMRPGGSTGY